MYKIGDHLAHPGHGVCTVQEICTKSFGGQTILYFILIPESDPHTTVMVPVEKAEMIGIRDIITSETADQILSFLMRSEDKADWNSDSKSRKKTYETAMKGSDLFALAEMIRSLLVQESTVVLNNYDKAILPKAEKRLLSEIALAKGLCFDDTLSMVCHAIKA
ncbi:MAG: hypothetical protein BGN88_01250 [Clostridiales bacterium 43-6]|nr:MAG: hypothetical protein BGN88_01250 [Clostridiales bacterium 43-6]